MASNTLVEALFCKDSECRCQMLFLIVSLFFQGIEFRWRSDRDFAFFVSEEVHVVKEIAVVRLVWLTDSILVNADWHCAFMSILDWDCSRSHGGSRRCANTRRRHENSTDWLWSKAVDLIWSRFKLLKRRAHHGQLTAEAIYISVILVRRKHLFSNPARQQYPDIVHVPGPAWRQASMRAFSRNDSAIADSILHGKPYIQSRTLMRGIKTQKLDVHEAYDLPITSCSLRASTIRTVTRTSSSSQQ